MRGCGIFAIPRFLVFNNIDVFRLLNIATMAVGAAVFDRRERICKADGSPEGGLLENSRCELAYQLRYYLKSTLSETMPDVCETPAAAYLSRSLNSSAQNAR
jgi:hypothetical protein